MYPISTTDRFAFSSASSNARRAEFALSAPVAIRLWHKTSSPSRSTAFEVEDPISTPATITLIYPNYHVNSAAQIVNKIAVADMA